MSWGSRSRVDVIARAAIIVVCPVVAGLAVIGGKSALLGVAAFLALIIGVYVGARHPLWLFWGLAVVLGALPFGYVPGVHVPLVLSFATVACLAALLHPSAQSRLHPMAVAVLLMLTACGVSMVATMTSSADIVEYVKWAIATVLVIALLSLSTENQARFGRIFVYAAAVDGLFGMAIVAATPHPIIKVLSPFGYGRSAVDTRFVYTDQGTAQSVRLGALWVDPNAAGICLLIATAMSLVLLTGWRRVVFFGILAVSTVLTLSRSAILTMAFAVVLVLLFHVMQPRVRTALIAGVGASVVASALVPAVRNRVLMSGDDFSSRARTEAIHAFPHQLAGHWIFGLGWGRPEFTNGKLAFTLNHVSNAPLLAIYRGGLLSGLAFCIVLAVGCVIGWRAIRSDSLTWALYGAIFIGYTFVALELDHPVVGVPPITTTFSLLIVYLAYIDRQRTAQHDAQPPAHVAEADNTAPIPVAR